MTLPKLPKVVLFLVKDSVLATEKATKNQKIMFDRQVKNTIRKFGIPEDVIQQQKFKYE